MGTPPRVPGEERHRAVDGIDQPPAANGAASDATTLLAQYAIAGPLPTEHVEYRALDGEVGFADR